MSTAVTKATSAKTPSNPANKAKLKPAKNAAANLTPAVAPPANAVPPLPFQALHDGLESIREFVRTVDAWEDFEDAIQAMAAVGLLQRVIYRLEGHSGPVLRADDGRLDAALDKRIRPQPR